MARALVLNASYEPLQVVGWQKAIILWFQGKVDILEHHDQFVRSVRMTFQVPSIIRLRTYVNVHQKPSLRFSRENVYLRDNYECQYCGLKFSIKDLTLDHVIPVSRGGPKDWKNIVTCCRLCNQKKGNRTPQEAHMPLLKKPVKPRALPHMEIIIQVHNAPESWKTYLQIRV